MDKQSIVEGICMYCKNCGKEIEDSSKYCLFCGTEITNSTNNETDDNDKKFSITLLLCLFLGFTGAHRFYTGHIVSGIFQLILSATFICVPVSLIWVLIDFIRIITGHFSTKQNQIIKPSVKINETLKKIICVIISVIVAFIVLCFIIGIILTINTSNDIQPVEDKTLLTKEKYGENYPYTIDNLRLKCENQAVWVEDKALNKYALNGLAHNKFQGRKDFKGYTTEIQIKGKPIDGDFLSMGFELCK